MRKGLLMLGFVVLALPAAAATPAEEQELLKKRITGFAAAWNKHDPKAMASFWASDGDLINPSVWPGVASRSRE